MSRRLACPHCLKEVNLAQLTLKTHYWYKGNKENKITECGKSIKNTNLFIATEKKEDVDCHFCKQWVKRR